mgnify:FL=1
MSWKDILKSEDTALKLMRMSNAGKLRNFLEKAKKEIEDYALPLLKKRFPVITEKDLSDTSVSAIRPFRVSAGGSFMNTNAFKDIKKGVKFKLGELTIDPYRLATSEFGLQTTGIVFGSIYFNNVLIGEISAYESESGPSRWVEIQYNGYYGGDPEDVAIAELYKKIKGE